MVMPNNLLFSPIYLLIFHNMNVFSVFFFYYNLFIFLNEFILWWQSWFIFILFFVFSVIQVSEIIHGISFHKKHIKMQKRFLTLIKIEMKK